MTCRQVSTYNGAPGSGQPTGGGYPTEAECLNACKEGACCTGTTCSVKPQCQCQGTGQVFVGIGTTCAGCGCNCPAVIRFEVSLALTNYERQFRGSLWRGIYSFSPTTSVCEAGGFVGYISGGVYLKCDSTGFWVEVTTQYELCGITNCLKKYKSGYITLEKPTSCTRVFGACGANGYPVAQTLTQSDFTLVSDDCPPLASSPCNGKTLPSPTDYPFEPYTTNTFPQWITVNQSTNPLP